MRDSGQHGGRKQLDPEGTRFTRELPLRQDRQPNRHLDYRWSFDSFALRNRALVAAQGISLSARNAAAALQSRSALQRRLLVVSCDVWLCCHRSWPALPDREAARSTE